MRLVPVGKLTFPDQQQDLQNAADFSVASECDGSVKFARLSVKVDSAGFWSPGGVWVGWSVSEVRAAFVTSFPRRLQSHRDRGVAFSNEHFSCRYLEE